MMLSDVLSKMTVCFPKFLSVFQNDRFSVFQNDRFSVFQNDRCTARHRGESERTAEELRHIDKRGRSPEKEKRKDKRDREEKREERVERRGAAEGELGESARGSKTKKKKGKKRGGKKHKRLWSLAENPYTPIHRTLPATVLNDRPRLEDRKERRSRNDGRR